MTAAAISLRVYTGAGAATESPAQSAVTLVADDALTGGDVEPGSRSFERWMRLKLDTAPDMGAANFWLMNTGELPDGVSLLFGVTDTPATPVDTASVLATKVLTSGQRFIFDDATLAEAGEYSRYVVVQEVVAADADSGAIPAQSLQWGWMEA